MGQINMKKNSKGEGFLRTSEEDNSIERLKEIHLNLVTRMDENWNQHSLVTLRRQTLSRILYYDWVYKKLIEKPGVICEFGVQWGGVLSLLHGLRSMYEPYNHSRKIFGFDTFSGFTNIDPKDGIFPNNGDYSVDLNYENELFEILNIHERNSPLNHIQKTFLIKGDASITINKWLLDNPSLVIGLAIFDMDIYKPTKDVLSAIKPRLFKGSVLVFDEFSCNIWPGETLAIDEVIGINNLKFIHYSHQPSCAICVIE